MWKMRGRMKPCVLKCDFDYDAFMAVPKFVPQAKSRRKKKVA